MTIGDGMTDDDLRERLLSLAESLSDTCVDLESDLYAVTEQQVDPEIRHLADAHQNITRVHKELNQILDAKGWKNRGVGVPHLRVVDPDEEIPF